MDYTRDTRTDLSRWEMMNRAFRYCSKAIDVNR